MTKRMTNKAQRPPLTFDTAPDLVLTPQAATLLNVHLNTIQTWIKTGKLPAVRVGRTWRIKLVDLRRIAGLDDSDALRAENERLRAALLKIANGNGEAVAIAKEALGGLE